MTRKKQLSPLPEGDHQDYVFQAEDGEIMKSAYISLRFSKLLAQNGLRHIRFHDLRHGCAGMLISERVPLIEVQQWLGHSNISTTADMYAHLDYSMKKRSATTLTSQLYAAPGSTLVNEKECKIKHHNKEIHHG